MESLLHDLRYAARVLLKSPGFAAAAVLALAMGIGASTAIFSIVDCVLLRPLRYEESDQLVRVFEDNIEEDRVGEGTSPPDFLDLRAESRSFGGIAAIAGRPFNLTGAEHPERIIAMLVTDDFFPILQATALLGRVFTEEEFGSSETRAFAMILPREIKASSPVPIVLSHGLWERRFGGNTGILGRTVELDGMSAEVVGVMPEDFAFREIGGWGEADCWIPQFYKADENPPSHYLSLLARLKPGVSLQEAQAEMNVMARRLESKRPDANSGWTLRVVSLQEAVVGDIGRQLWTLLGAVSLVLLIACANVANLLLVRASARRRETALRACLGAGRRQLIRPLILEALFLALLAGVAGFGLALWGVDIVKGLSPEQLPRLEEVAVDWRIFAFTILASVMTALLCSVLPAFASSKTDLRTQLTEGVTVSAGGQRRWMGKLLVTCQIALTLILLIGAGLLVRSFLNLAALELGFNPHGVLTFQISRPYRPGSTFSDSLRLWRELVERVERVPGARWVAAGSTPLRPGGGYFEIWPGERAEPVVVQLDASTPSYFQVLQIALLQGRYFNELDTQQSAPVAIIDRATAARIWPDENPIGRKILIGSPDSGKYPAVVGVVENVRITGLVDESPPKVYLPLDQSIYFLPGTMLIRTDGDPGKIFPAVQSAVWSVDPELALVDVATMEQRLSKELAPWRFRLFLMGAFSVLAFLLATLGVYGMMAYSATQRTREIGIRMALGAQIPDVLRLIVGEGLALIALGIGLGLLGAAALNRALAGMVFGVTTTDGGTYLLVTLVWVLASILACYLPARRASKVDPMMVLRYE